MSVQTGRTVNRWINFIIGDTNNVLRSIPVATIGGVGLNYEAKDVTAVQDAVKNELVNLPSSGMEITGPFDTTAAASSPSLSGSHTILSVINGDNTPHTLDIQFGMRHAWEAGEPQFGFSRTATSGIIVTSYEVDVANMTYKAKLGVYGSVAPAWGTAAET